MSLKKNRAKSFLCFMSSPLISCHLSAVHYQIKAKKKLKKTTTNNQSSRLLCGRSLWTNRTNSEISFSLHRCGSPFFFCAVRHQQSSWFPFWCQHRGQRSQREWAREEGVLSHGFLCTGNHVTFNPVTPIPPNPKITYRHCGSADTH